jgi:FG-GAP-like repeat
MAHVSEDVPGAVGQVGRMAAVQGLLPPYDEYLRFVRGARRGLSCWKATGETLSGRCAISRLRTGLAFGALLTVVVAGWLAIFSAPSPATSPSPRSTQNIVPADTSAKTADVTLLSDFNSDRLTDLVAVDKVGVLWLYPGYGAGAFKAWSRLDTGWFSFTAIATPGDVTGDGIADIIARDSGGHLWLCPGTGASGLGDLRQIGSGWNVMNLITAAGDMTGDGQPDILARDTTGKLWLYPLTGDATLQPRRSVGLVWSGYTIVGPGDVSGDGRADILARNTDGKLWLYRGNGTGDVATGTLVSTGWQTMTALVTPGNWDRAGGNDLLARDPAGRLLLFPGDNAGGFGEPRQIGSGWNGYTIS